MEIIRGKQSSVMDAAAFAECLYGYESIQMDIGTGDGRYARHIAESNPRSFVIGIDACRENLRTGSRRASANALFVIANAQALPHDLYGLAARITINFPWGSLLERLLENDAALLEGLMCLSRPGMSIEVRLNAGALAECGYSLKMGTDRIQNVLGTNGFIMQPPTLMTACELRSYPTTWAKRLAFGRDPRAFCLWGTMGASIAVMR